MCALGGEQEREVCELNIHIVVELNSDQNIVQSILSWFSASLHAPISEYLEKLEEKPLELSCVSQHIQDH